MNTNPWKLYVSPPEAWTAMLEACERATSSIDLEQYLFEVDSVGKKFLEVCIKKAHEGLNVRIICDAVGSNSLFLSRIPEILLKAGIQIVFYNSFIIGTPGYYTTWFFRDHRKLLIIDKKIGFTGGICFRAEMKDWRDTHVRIEGNVVTQMEQAFEDMWNRAHKIKRRPKTKYIFKNNDEFAYVPQLPLPRKRYAYYVLIQQIKKAEKYIFLTTPYFLPDHKLLKSLKQAVRRGVSVCILTPEHSDHPIVDIGAHSYITSILKSGIRIFHYRSIQDLKSGIVLHAKTAVIDDTWCSVGSLNLDNVSLRYNFEANLTSTNNDFIQEIKSHFMTDLKASDEILLSNWIKRSYYNQFLEILIWPIRKIL